MNDDRGFDMEKEKKGTLWTATFTSLFVIGILLNLSSKMSDALLSLYAKSIGAPADQIGTLMSMFALTALLFRFVAGPAMNAYNRKKILQIAMMFFFAAYFGFGISLFLSRFTGIDVIYVLMFFRLLQGIGSAFGNACLLTIVSDFLPKESFSSGISVFALAQTVAQAIGPTVGVYCRDLFGYNATYFITAAIIFLSILLIAVSIHMPNTGSGKLEFNLSNMIAKEALVPALIMFLISFGFTSINAFFLVYAEERGISNASYYFTVNAIALMVTKPLIGKLNDKYGFVKVALPACLLTALSLVLIGYSTKLWHLLVIAIINSFGYGAAQPVLQSICMKAVPAEKRGSASSTNYIALDSATLFGPIVCGIVANSLGYTPTMWIVMTIPVMMAFFFTILFKKNLQKIEDDFISRSANK